MANNNNFRLNGLNPLAYMGVNPVTPVPFVCRPFDPTPTDYANFLLGTLWLNTSNQNVWMLVSKANYVATWIKFAASSGDLQTLTGDTGGAVSPSSNNINIIAQTTAGSSVLFVGNVVANTLQLGVTDANGNTIIGLDAGNSSLTGAFNVSLGGLNLGALTSGGGNTVLGAGAAIDLTTGSFNTLLGGNAAPTLTTGSNNILIGASVGSNYTTNSSNILIGNAGNSGDANVIRIGNQGSGSGEQDGCFIAGIVGVTVDNPNFVTIDTASGQLGATESVDVATQYEDNAGDFAVPSAGILKIVGDGTTAVTAASGNTITISAMGGGSGTSYSLISGQSPSQLSSTSATHWFCTSSSPSASTQSDNQSVVPTAGTVSHLNVYISANTSTTNTTVTLNKNSSNTALVATIPAGMTGTFSDTTHSVTFAAGDLLQWECSTSTTGTTDGVITCAFGSGGGSGTVIDVIGGNNITITGTSTIDPVVNVSGTTNHCVQLGNSTGSLTSLANGTTGQILTANTGADPSWTNAPSLTTIAFQAYQQTYQNVSGSYTMGTSSALTIQFNQGSGFYAGSGSGAPATFTAPVTGIYNFTFNATGGSSIGAYPNPKPKIITPTATYSSVGISGGFTGGNTNPVQVTCSALVSLNSGDVVTFSVTLASSSGFYIAASDGSGGLLTWINGFLV